MPGSSAGEFMGGEAEGPETGVVGKDRPDSSGMKAGVVPWWIPGVGRATLSVRAMKARQ
jgi:hypothetical protein